MTYDVSTPGLFVGGRRWRAASRRLTLAIAAGAIALTAFASSARPARADAEDLLRFLAGALIVGAIVNAIDDNHTPQYHGRWVLPGSCLETYRVRGRHVDAYNTRCLARAGYRGLPQHCERTFRDNGRQRRAFVAACLYDAGYRRGGGYHSPPPWTDPREHPIGGPYDRPPSVAPAQPPIHSLGRFLPEHCRMHYRQNGQRIAGYWGSCLRDAGLRDLPRHCRVRTNDGRGIFTARCLRDAGYRRR